MSREFSVKFDNTMVHFSPVGLKIEGERPSKETADKILDFICTLHVGISRTVEIPKSTPKNVKSIILLIADFLLPTNTIRQGKEKAINKITGRQAVYIIRQIDQIMYIGQTGQGALTRLREHITQKDAIGKEIANSDDINVWTIEIIPVLDRNELSKYEQSLIKKFKPILNIKHNK